ncbi:hypothetical protein HDU98_006082 [Podochytrium sp. JEL0797]|nr:hypothetical protein HDU98_006082 [Podochytrium sp. JEL0797]
MTLLHRPAKTAPRPPLGSVDSPRTALVTALQSQAKALDSLNMPPPPPRTKAPPPPSVEAPASDEKENSTAKAKTPVKDKSRLRPPTPSATAQTRLAAKSPLAANKKTAYLLEPKGSKRKTVLSPSTPFPVEVKLDLNQLSRNKYHTPYKYSLFANAREILNRPSKSFHQKLSEAATPPPKAIKAGSKYNTPIPVKTEGVHDNCKTEIGKRDIEIAALKEEIQSDKRQILNLERQVQSRNSFIGRIESVAKATAEKLAVNQAMLLDHMEKSSNYK